MAFSRTFLRRGMAASALALALAACGGDSNGPNPAEFDGAGTREDVQAIVSAFENDALQSLWAVGGDVGAALGDGASTTAIAGLDDVRLGATDPRAAAERLWARYGTREGISYSAAGIPASALGKTFVWDEAGDGYVASARDGAPANGVRFVLYAISPTTHAPVEPLQELGYADITETSNGGRLEVYEGGTKLVDYRVAGSFGTTSAELTVDGFVSDGTDRAEFAIAFEGTQSATTQQLGFDFEFDVPTRNVQLDYSIDMTTTEAGGEIVMDLSLAGPNGNVSLDGTIEGSASGETGGEFEVRTDGELFATITVASGATEPTIVGADGAPLDEAESAALTDLLELLQASTSLIDQLLDPLAAFVQE